MRTSVEYREAVGQLRAIARRQSDETLAEFVEARDEVLARYQPIFTPEAIPDLNEETFREFLMYRNNRHWSGLQRLGPRITEDMDGLREALLELIDESVPIAERMNRLLPGGKARVHKLGKAVLTPILLIVYPSRYGVWNGTSEGAMQELEIWPDFERGTSIGERYERVNELLLQLAADLETDLWTLDALWWRFLNPPEAAKSQEEISVDEELDEAIFGLERHLHDFLLDNWEHTELGQEWELAEEGGDIKGYGYERITDVGKIDLLAHHQSEPRWLVIELKRDRSSDSAVGQVLRYMGWVREKIADDSEAVEGLIISRDHDPKLKYALSQVPSVRFQRYKVQFELVETEL